MVEYTGGYDWKDIYEERYHELQKKNNDGYKRNTTGSQRIPKAVTNGPAQHG